MTKFSPEKRKYYKIGVSGYIGAGNNIKGTSNNYFTSRFSEFFIDDENLWSTIEIMWENLKKYMENSKNPIGTNIINNLLR